MRGSPPRCRRRRRPLPRMQPQSHSKGQPRQPEASHTPPLPPPSSGDTCSTTSTSAPVPAPALPSVVVCPGIGTVDLSGDRPRFFTESEESDDDEVDEGELDEDGDNSESGNYVDPAKFLLDRYDPERTVDPETQARLEALLEVAGVGKLSTGEGKHLADPEVLRRLTSSVSCALDEAAAALTRMRTDQPRNHNTDKSSGSGNGSNGECALSLAEACSDGDVGTVRKLLTEGRSVHETTEEGESLLSLACSAGYYELAQVLLAMHANVEDRGIKNDCTPLMEAASAGHQDIVKLLIAHRGDVNAQSSSGNTPLMYGCAGGHEGVVTALLEAGANVEDHNENGHTPLMEAASAGHVGVAKILLEHGAGINTHSNEFKESALTLACYKGHLDMVRFLLAAGADQEHKTDEMHTALMEASMDGHVEVARLLLDSGAQVNMPTDSFESPLTLAACGGHVDLALLLIERGANIEEVNDEGYTPLMEAAREGHEEMVALLLSQGANINAQTEETQETALTLACCGGFLEVADFLIKAGADIELGASTPLMEAAQEGHLDLVRFLLEVGGADVHAQTQTGDTALTYAAENGHTDVADLLLQHGADLEHESEGGRTPLMKACRAGHLCTVQFLVLKKANVNRTTTNNDHTPLSLACAGGHVETVKYLLTHAADPFHKLKDNSTMLIEAAKGGHTLVVQTLLDYPRSVIVNIPPLPPPPHQQHSINPHNTPVPDIGADQVPSAGVIDESGAPTADDVYSPKNQAFTRSIRPLAPIPHHLIPRDPEAAHFFVKGWNDVLLSKQTLQNSPDNPNFVANVVQTHMQQQATFNQLQQQIQHHQQQIQLHQQQHFLQQQILLQQQQFQSHPVHQQPTQPLGPPPGLPLLPPEKLQQQQNLLQQQQQLQLQNLQQLQQAAQYQLQQQTSQAQQQQQQQQQQPPLMATAGKHKMVVRKSRVVPIPHPQDHHLPPPPDLTQAVRMNPMGTESDNNTNLDMKSSKEHQFCYTQPLIEQLQRLGRTVKTNPADSVVEIPKGVVLMDSGEITPAPTLRVPLNVLKSFYEGMKSGLRLNDLKVVDQHLDLNLEQMAANAVPTQPSQVQVQNSQVQATTNTTQTLQTPIQNTAVQDRPKVKPVQTKLKETKASKKYYSPDPPLNKLTPQQQQQSQIQLQPQQQQGEQPQLPQQQQQQSQVQQQQLQTQQQPQQDQPQPDRSQLMFLQKYHSDLVDGEESKNLDLNLKLEQKIISHACRAVKSSSTAVKSQGTEGTRRLYTISEDPNVENVILYLQKKIPSLVNVPMLQLESLVLLILQQKKFETDDINHKIISNTIEKLLMSWVAKDWCPSTKLPPLPPLASLQQSLTEEAFAFDAITRDQLTTDQDKLELSAACLEDELNIDSIEPFEDAIPGVESLEGPLQSIESDLQAMVQDGSLNNIPLPPSLSRVEIFALTGNNQGATNNAILDDSTSPYWDSTSALKTVLSEPELLDMVFECDSPHKRVLLDALILGQLPPPVRQLQAQSTQTQSHQHHVLQSQQFVNNQQLQQAISDPKTQQLIHQSHVQQQPQQQQHLVNQQQQQQVHPSLHTCQQTPLHTIQQQTIQHQLQQQQQQQQLQQLQIQQQLQQQQQQQQQQQPQLSQQHGQHIQQQQQQPQQPQQQQQQQPVPQQMQQQQQAQQLQQLQQQLHQQHQQIQQQHQKLQQQQAQMYMDVDGETESNHDTALTLACAGGHEDLVELLLSRGADIEHRDKKGFTPLILAATAGHEKVVEILLNHGADIEAQSERTKDTPLSLACSGGRYEIVELILNRGANKEHRNVSDYTPLSLAASGGYVNIIRLLLTHQAEINSRTGSKLGISPLMLAAMNGHTAAVRLLLDMGSDINAQIETNRNTALTLACFQGRHEVVSLLLDRKANVEHRAKTGLTPLMEAASGGYVEVGRVLIEKGADVNATPVPSSRDTALTIAADKGHSRFVELLLQKGALVEVKNKKGNSPLWLAANGGHLSVVEMLHNAGADIDSQDNRKVSCLMAAFRKGHVKTVKWMVNVVTQFPSDQEMTRYVCTLSDKELLEKCHECIRAIRAAKETQAQKANINASILLEELDQERSREETKRLAAARRRERKKKKKLEKKEEKKKFTEGTEPSDYDKNDQDEDDSDREELLPKLEEKAPSPPPVQGDKEEGDSGIDANSQGSCSSGDVKTHDKSKNKKKKKPSSPVRNLSSSNIVANNIEKKSEKIESAKQSNQKSDSKLAAKGENKSLSNLNSNDTKSKQEKENVAPPTYSADNTPSKQSKDKQNKSTYESTLSSTENKTEKKDKRTEEEPKPNVQTNVHKTSNVPRKGIVFESSRHPADREDFEATGNDSLYTKGKKAHNTTYFENESIVKVVNKPLNKREEGWKEVVRKSNVQVSTVDPGSKKVSVPLHAISRVIGRAGSNINAIRAATGAHIEVEKQSKGQGERAITIKGSPEATKQAHILITTMIKDPDVDILQMLPRLKPPVTAASTSWDKTHTVLTTKSKVPAHPTTTPSKVPGLLTISATPPKLSGSTSGAAPVLTGSSVPVSSTSKAQFPGYRPGAAPRLIAQAEKRAAAIAGAVGSSQSIQIQTSTSQSNQPAQTQAGTKTTMSYTSAIMASGRGGGTPVSFSGGTFAAKLGSNSTEQTVVIATPSPIAPRARSQPSNWTNETSSQNSNNLNQPISTAASVATSQLITTSEYERKQSQPQSQQNVSIPSSHSSQGNDSHASFSPVLSSNSGNASTSSNISSPGSINSATQQHLIQQHLNNALHIITTSANNNNNPQQGSGGLSSTHEYSLFKNIPRGGMMWGVCNDLNENSQNKPDSSTSPNTVDAAKAPGYRGNAGCSPVSHSLRTSSHSTSPPGPMPSHPYSNFSDMSSGVQQGLGIQRMVGPPGPIGSTNVVGNPGMMSLSNSMVGNSNSPGVNIGPIGMPGTAQGNGMSNYDVGGISRNGPIYSDNNRNTHNLMQQMSISASGGGYDTSSGMVNYQPIGSGGPPSRLNPRAPDFNQPAASQTPLLQHSSQSSIFPNNYTGHTSGGSGVNNAPALNALLLASSLSSFQQRPQPPSTPPPKLHPTYVMPPTRNQMSGAMGGSTIGRWTSFGGSFPGDLGLETQSNGPSSDDSGSRKAPPRPIGMERAWKHNMASTVGSGDGLPTSIDDWTSHYPPPSHNMQQGMMPPNLQHHQTHGHLSQYDDTLDRYQQAQLESMNGGLNILPMHYMNAPMSWDPTAPQLPTPEKQQSWGNKWSN